MRISDWSSDVCSSDLCEIVYDDVRIPKENILGRVGDGHQVAQDRLGAGRVFHCMNSIGQMWRAFDLMAARALTREVHGGLLKEQQFVDRKSTRLNSLHHCASPMPSSA